MSIYKAGWIYAVREEGTPLVKIGYTSVVTMRLAELKTQYRVPLTLLATVHVERWVSRIERTIHSILASARIQDSGIDS
jgi:Meiotically up-regulated gene 113